MDSGAYGSYPKRRRYNVGKYISKKYGTRKAYSNRTNPNKQFSYGKTRVGKYTKTNMQSLKCTYTDDILQLAGAFIYSFQSTTQQYLNLATILAGSPEFVSRVTQFSYFKLSGMQVILTRRWFDPVALGVDGTSAGFTSLAPGLAMITLNFYPNLISSVVGQPVENADSSWDVSAFIHGNQSHYQPFPRDFTTGSNSYGLGVWNACNGYTNIAGELAIYSDNAAIASDFGNINIWDVEINIYAQFCNNTGT